MISQRQLFLRHVAQTSDSPLMLEIERAEGIFLYDNTGRRYLDLISGIAVSNVGHCHPQVVEAVKKQAETYMHLMVYGEYVQSPQVQLAQLLCAQLPGTLDNVYFVNSGAEAVDAAMKLSKRFTGRGQMIACHNAYHGSTQGPLSLNSHEYFKNAFRPLLPGVRFIRFNNTDDLKQISTQTACVIIEPVQGEAGCLSAERNYLQQLRDVCTQTGTLLVLDEIQTGFGRTGPLFAFEDYGIVPDILLLAKGMGGGMPIGALVASQKIMQAFTHDPYLGHITTFGGHPVSCAAAKASLEVLLGTKNLAEETKTKGDFFRSRLGGHPAVLSVSGKGLMLALEFDSFETTKRVITQCISKGVITDWFLFASNKLRIAPPLTIKMDEISFACEVINQSISEICE